MNTKLRIINTNLPEVKIIQPKVFADSRGLFTEIFNQKEFVQEIGNYTFVQENESLSNMNVIRGIHYQIKKPQAKLVRCISGDIIDVAVDLRKSSTNFGKHVRIYLRAEVLEWLWIPEGFGHAFLSLDNNVRVCYKTTEFYHPEHDCCINAFDPEINIDWWKNINPLEKFIRSEKDKNSPMLKNAKVFE